MISCPERVASHSMVAAPPVRLRYTQSEPIGASHPALTLTGVAEADHGRLGRRRENHRPHGGSDQGRCRNQ